MSLAWLSPLAFFAGLAVLGGVLFALQRLRVRHRTVIVPTTLFWREALEDARARVFVQRFRHPWAFLLILAIASLAWLAVAGPSLPANGAREHVLVLDASARMGIGSRFAEALKALEERAASLPRRSTRVLVAGAHVRTLLDRGEALPLLERRARELAPEACPSTLPRALHDACSTESAQAGVDVEVFGDSPIDPGLVALLGHDVHVHRAMSPPSSATNTGLIALGVSDSASGMWNRVDVLVRVHGPAAMSAHVALDGHEVPVEWQTIAEASVAQGVLRDVHAGGGRIDAWVDAGDVLAADDRASMVLPVRPQVRVALSPGVPAAIVNVLRSDPGVAIVDDASDVVVRNEGEVSGGTTPALVLCATSDRSAAFVVRHPDTGEHERTLRAAFVAIGLDEIDATEIADRAARPITLELETADVRGISVWGALLEPQYDFTSQRAFPLFVARAVRWLAGSPSFETASAAGAPRFGAIESWTDSRGVPIDTLGVEARFPRAGETVTSGGSTRSVSLLDLETTSLATDERALPDVEVLRASFAPDPLTMIVLILLALSLCEWWLVRTERMP